MSISFLSFVIFFPLFCSQSYKKCTLRQKKIEKCFAGIGKTPTFAPHFGRDGVSTTANDITLGYSIRVVQQILVLFVLVRIRVAQPPSAVVFLSILLCSLGYSIRVVQQILVLFVLVRIRVAQRRESWTSFKALFLSIDTQIDMVYHPNSS